MLHRYFLIAITICAILTLASGASGWQMQAAPLMTDWAALVTPSNALVEYPRPQMVRTDWMNLNGVWQFKRGYSTDTVPVGQTLGSEIMVPYPVESAISGIKQHFDRVWYRRTFTVPTAWAGKRVTLNFGAIDWETEVYINGTSMGMHQGGYDSFSYDITPYLNPSGGQEIIVRVFDPTTSGAQPHGKQTNSPGGIFYTATTGIWQTVWLEPVEATGISSLKIVPDVDGGRLKLTVNTTGSTTESPSRQPPKIRASPSGRSPALRTPNSTSPSPARSSGRRIAHSYTTWMYRSTGGSTLDTVTSYFGMRKIQKAPWSTGFYKLVLNNHSHSRSGRSTRDSGPTASTPRPPMRPCKWDMQTEKRSGSTASANTSRWSRRAGIIGATNSA